MRKLLLASLIILTAIALLARLYYLQVVSDISDKNIEQDVAIEAVYDYPERGYIYDRNGNLLVANQPAYDIMIIPREVKDIDTLEFCSLLNITKEDFTQRFHKARTYSPIKPSVFIPQLSKEEYAILQEKCVNTTGFIFKNVLYVII